MAGVGEAVQSKLKVPTVEDIDIEITYRSCGEALNCPNFEEDVFSLGIVRILTVSLESSI